jgi:hypothetical protein
LEYNAEEELLNEIGYLELCVPGLDVASMLRCGRPRA